MTPRALLTAIGATAFAFAVAIGAASGSSTVLNTSESSPVAFAAPAELDRLGDVDRFEGKPAASDRHPGTVRA